MTTAAQIINRATGLLGVRAVGQTLDVAIVADCFDHFRTMLDGLANDPGLFPSVEVSVALTAGVPTVALAGAPYDVEYGWIGSEPDLVEVVPQNFFDGLDDNTTGQPDYLFYDGSGTISVYPTPDQNYTLKLRIRGQSLGFTAITTDVALDPGMDSMLTNTLAVTLAPLFEKMPSQLLVIAAIGSKKSIRRRNHQSKAVDCPFDARRNFDIVRGDYK